MWASGCGRYEHAVSFSRVGSLAHLRFALRSVVWRGRQRWIWAQCGGCVVEGGNQRVNSTHDGAVRGSSFAVRPGGGSGCAAAAGDLHLRERHAGVGVPGRAGGGHGLGVPGAAEGADWALEVEAVCGCRTHIPEIWRDVGEPELRGSGVRGGLGADFCRFSGANRARIQHGGRAGAALGPGVAVGGGEALTVRAGGGDCAEWTDAGAGGGGVVRCGAGGALGAAKPGLSLGGRAGEMAHSSDWAYLSRNHQDERAAFQPVLKRRDR